MTTPPLLHDDHPLWLQFRCEELEHKRGIFNVDPNHVCWAPGASDMMVLDPGLRVHVCMRCGRLHECTGEIHPTMINPVEGSYVCVFSGQVVDVPDPILGTYDNEVQAHEAAYVSSALPWFDGKKEARQQRTAGNFAMGQERSKHFRTAKNALSLGHSALIVSRYSQGQSKEEVGSFHEQARVMYDPQERERDCDYQRRFFQPIETALEPLRALFAVGPTPPVQPPSPEKPVPKLCTPKGRNTVEDGRLRLGKTIEQVMGVFEALTPVTHEWPPASARLEYYTKVMTNLIEFSSGKRLHQLQENELSRQAIVLMLDVLATTMRDQDSAGHSLLLWVADPWLQWCKQNKVVQALIKFDKWNNAASKPYLARTSNNASRKRKRSTVEVGHGLATTQEPAVAELRALPTALRRVLIQSARNISHQGNAIRSSIYERRLSPQTVYTLVHRGLL